MRFHIKEIVVGDGLKAYVASHGEAPSNGLSFATKHERDNALRELGRQGEIVERQFAPHTALPSIPST